MIGKKIMVAVFLMINSLFLSGCWGMREINELSMVMAVAIDKEPEEDAYTVTVQIAKSAPPSSDEETKGGGGSKTWVVSAQGKTVFDAIRVLSQISSRRIMWAHNNVIIIGESVARDSILPVIDFFTHNPEVRMKTGVVVAKGNARQYLTSTTGMDEISGLGFREMNRYEPLTAQSVQSSMLILSRDYFSEDIQPVITEISFREQVLKPDEDASQKKEKILAMAGAALFNKDKMIGWLTPEETRGLAWLRNETKSTVVTVTLPSYGGRSISTEAQKIKSKIETEVNGDVPSVTIKLSGDIHIVEEDVATNMSMEEFKQMIENAVDKQITSDIRLTVDKVQKEYNIDVLGFGLTTHAQHKKEWDRIKDRWASIFPEIPVKILVDVKAKNSTTLRQPMQDIKKAGDR